MQKTTLNIEGMTCDHCVGSVTRTLEGFDDVSDILVSLSENTAQFAFEPEKTSLSDISKSIEEEGCVVKGAVDESS